MPNQRRPELFGKKAKSIPALLGDLKNLTVDYAKQETLNPLKGLIRYVIFGVLGSFVLSIGLVLWVVAVLRVLQTETGGAFDGNFTWAPYLLTLVICAVVIGLSVSAIFSDKRQAKKRKKKAHQAAASTAPGHAQ